MRAEFVLIMPGKGVIRLDDDVIKLGKGFIQLGLVIGRPCKGVHTLGNRHDF